MFKRSSGVLMPIFSLSNDLPIGNFGKTAYRFIDFLKEAKQSYWQILPLSPTGYGDSPYSGLSAFAGNTYFIDFEDLERNGWLNRSDYSPILANNWGERVDYGFIFENYRPILDIAVTNFLKKPPSDYQNFLDDNSSWLGDFSLFLALKEKFNHKAWYNWPQPYKFKDEETIKKNWSSLEKSFHYHQVSQYFFHQQWLKVKKYANENNIQIIGDLPIYLALDSADVWSRPDLFLLDENKEPTFLAGTPPDDFSRDGQFWGNPIYDWNKMKENNYAWWIKRFEKNFELYDVIRLDHFRGYQAYWQIPSKSKTAASGKWVKGPGIDFFDQVKKKFPHAKIIAEDLGHITPDVRQLLKDTEFPGLNVLQFAFNLEDSNYLPHNYEKNSVAYVGTHDNMTSRGWYQNQPPRIQDQINSYTNRPSNQPVSQCLNRLIASSVSNLAIYTMQDLLNLDNLARINKPGTSSGNWTWRMNEGSITPRITSSLKSLTSTYFRYNK